MKLKFYAKQGLLVHRLVPRAKGMPVRYAGRKFVPLSSESKQFAGAFVADPDGVEVEADSPEGRKLLREVMLEDSLWPANKETAEACGKPFVPVRFDATEREFVEDSATASALGQENMTPGRAKASGKKGNE